MSRQQRIRKGTISEERARAFSAGLQRAVQLPLFDSLADCGGRARPAEIYDRIADNLNIDQASREETRTCADGQSYKVFQHQVRWARQTAVARGLIAGERGIWELTDRGYAELGRINRGKAILLYTTNDGIALWAHAEDAAEQIEAGTVHLVMTSPPYPVVKRAYGKFSVPEWLDWMRRLMAIWKELVTPTGTIAINLMDVHVSCSPALSPYVERFTLAAIDDVGLHLAGRMPWYSPTKLGHIEWSSKRKVRPKNVMEHVLLFSPSPDPAWDITRMDRKPYAGRSAEQERRDAVRSSRKRPSGLDLNEAAFQRTEHGPLPGNLIIAGGVSGSDAYSRRCREVGLKPHPARFPDALPRQIIQMTTDAGDIVYDPMAGSNKTGAVASELGRRFIASEPMHEYLLGSATRFDHRPDFRSFQ